MQNHRLYFALLGWLINVMAAAKHDGYIMPQTQVIPIFDEANQQQYELYLKLPENYATEPDKTYPVIYYTDAVWHIEVLSAATAYMLEDVILVGISWQQDLDPAFLQQHGPHFSRFRDYSVKPLSDAEKQAKYQFGQAQQHLAFIRQQVMTHVDRHYRTNPSQRIYFGYSLGGLFGAYVLAAQPDAFSHYLIGSPALHPDNPILADLPVTQKDWPAQVYLTRGTDEQDLIEPNATFAQNMQSRYPNVSIESVVIEGNHQTAFPTTAIKAIAWLANLTQSGDPS